MVIIRVLVALLLALLISSAEASATASGFDAQLLQLERADSAAISQDQLEALRRQLPPRDERRGIRLRAFTCLRDSSALAALLDRVKADLRTAQRLGERGAELRLTYCWAGLLERVEHVQPSEPLAAYERGITLARELRDWRQLADGLVLRGSLHSLLGDQARALIDLLNSEALYEAIGRPRYAEGNLLYIGIAYRRMKEEAKALEYLQKSRALGERSGNDELQVSALIQMGFLHSDGDRPTAATAPLKQALALASVNGNHTQMGWARLGQAWVQIRTGQFTTALHTLALTQADFAAIQDMSSDDMIALRRGQALAGLGRHKQALDEYNRAWRVMQLQGHERYLSMLYPVRSASNEALGRYGLAVDDLQAQVILAEQLSTKMQSQQTELLRHRFDAARRDLDNQRLRHERALRQKELAAHQDAGRWRKRAMLVGGVLLTLLVMLAATQLARMRGLRRMALTDSLTQVANRRQVLEVGEAALRHARATSRALSVLVFDLDNFKQVNDLYGHGIGDKALVRVASACAEALRQGDVLGRTGGEEFLVLLPGSDRAVATLVAERVRRHVETLDLSELHPDLRVTVSIGVAQLDSHDKSLDSITQRADQALYQAKLAGRNRVEGRNVAMPQPMGA